MNQLLRETREERPETLADAEERNRQAQPLSDLSGVYKRGELQPTVLPLTIVQAVKLFLLTSLVWLASFFIGQLGVIASYGYLTLTGSGGIARSVEVFATFFRQPVFFLILAWILAMSLLSVRRSRISEGVRAMTAGFGWQVVYFAFAPQTVLPFLHSQPLFLTPSVFACACASAAYLLYLRKVANRTSSASYKEQGETQG